MPKTYVVPPSEAEGKAQLNNDAFYRLVMNGTFAGQANVNVFYYRVGLGLLPGGLNFGGAEALAYAFRNQFWMESLRDALPPTYTLEDITVYPYNGNFDPSVQLPFTLSLGDAGLALGNLPGSAAVLTCKYNLEGQVLGMNGWFPPKRGFTAWGPYRENDVDNEGRLTSIAQDFYAEKLLCLSQDLVNLVSLVTFWPIRISTTTVACVLTLRGFSDISGITIRPVVGFRQSRKLEG